MARKTYATMIKLQYQEAMRFFASVLASGKNPDGTDYAIPISGALTLDPTNLAISALQAPLSPTHTITNSADMSGGADVSAAPGAGLKLVVHELVISVGAAISVVLKEETSNTVIFGPYYMAANTTIHLSRNRLAKLPVAVKKLRATASGAGNITVETWCSTEA
jgi:hypothetical protein